MLYLCPLLQHGRFHPLTEFTEDRRSCTAALTRHNNRRIVSRGFTPTAAAATGAEAAAAAALAGAAVAGGGQSLTISQGASLGLAGTHSLSSCKGDAEACGGGIGSWGVGCGVGTSEHRRGLSSLSPSISPSLAPGSLVAALLRQLAPSAAGTDAAAQPWQQQASAEQTPRHIAGPRGTGPPPAEAAAAAASSCCCDPQAPLAAAEPWAPHTPPGAALPLAPP